MKPSDYSQPEETEPSQNGEQAISGDPSLSRESLSIIHQEKEDEDRRITGGSRWSLMLRAFRHRNYRIFFSGQMISLCGTWMQSVAQSWLVYRLTGSAMLLGVVGFTSQIPIFLFSPVGGAAADRYYRRRVLVLTQTASMFLAFALAALTLAGCVQVWHILILSFLLGLVNAFDIPTRQAFVVEMVGKKDILNAIALNSSMFNSARIIGPAIAGALVESIGEGWCFFLNGASYFAVILGLLYIQVPERERLQSVDSTYSHILEGFRYAWRTKTVRALLLMLSLLSVLGMPYAVLMPIFADRVLHGGPQALGLLMGAAGIGALAGALTLAARRGAQGLERWIAFSSAGFGACLVLFSWSKTFWLSAAILVPTGYFMIGQMASSNTLIQTIVPDSLRGRMMSLYSMMFIGMAPFGSLLAGALAHRLGAPDAVAIGGFFCMVGAAAFGIHLRTVRYNV